MVDNHPSDLSESITPWRLLGSLFLIGILLRFYNFWIPPLWLDEYVTWWIVSGDGWAEVVERALQAAGQSPFYNLVVKMTTSALNDGPFQLRIPSVVFGIATLAIVYPLAVRILHNKRAAVTSVVIFILSERLIYYSQNARPYSLSVLLTMLSFFCFLGITQTPRTKTILTYVIVTTLLIYSHLVFFLVVVVQAVYLILTRNWREITSKKWLFSLVAIGVLCIPVGLQMLDLYQTRHTLNWLPYVGQSNIMVEVVLILFSICHPLVLCPTIVALFVVGYARYEQPNSVQKDGLRLLWCWLITPVLFFGATPLILGMTFFHARYFVFEYPAAFFLFAWYITNVKPTNWCKWIPTLVFAACSVAFILVPALLKFGAFSFQTHPNWANAVKVLTTYARSTDLIVYRTGLVEADLFARSSVKPYLRSYVGWPIIANLPAGHSYNLLSLPFRLAEHTNEYFDLCQKVARQHTRVWVIGEGELITFFKETMISQHGYQATHQSFHEGVQVTLLERDRPLQ
jgi:uncharacterized membrane protein